MSSAMQAQAAPKPVTIDWLKETFGSPVNVAPYGECIVVQGDRFDPDWEAELGDQGFRCHFTDLDMRAVTLVQLKKAVAEGKVVYVPPKVPELSSVTDEVHSNLEVNETAKSIEVSKKFHGKPSSNIADSFIAELWNAGKNRLEVIDAVKEKFPTENICVDYRIQILYKTNQITRHGRNGGCLHGPEWSGIDEERLMKRLSEVSGATDADRIRKIASEFPDRNFNALAQKVTKLRKQPEYQTEKTVKDEKSEKSTSDSVGIKEPKIADEVAGAVLYDLQRKVSGLETAVMVACNSYNALNNAYNNLSKLYIELKTKVETIDNEELGLAGDIKHLIANTDYLKRDLARHTHEGLLPGSKVTIHLEAS